MRKAFVAVVVVLAARQVLRMSGGQASEGMFVFVVPTKTNICLAQEAIGVGLCLFLYRFGQDAMALGASSRYRHLQKCRFDRLNG